MKKIIVVALALMLAGCQAFTRLPDAESSVRNGAGSFEVRVPGGWVQYNSSVPGELIITKDGLSLQKIGFIQTELEKPFAALEIKLAENALITEIAEHYIEDYKARLAGATVEQESLEPVMLLGEDGFKMHLNAVTTAGLEYKILVYGTLKDKRFYSMSYQAPALYFFDKELAEFEAMAGSFRLVN
ncbi:hypothetical protein [Neptuniibacter halophilus]|uniref:hypothetical protein n=1 Tax=Neptuniibacter halophilus TaxID=651666 RepID=UPI00257345AC|nr:hypothetical protein [Neptuniibacter halophilus]